MTQMGMQRQHCVHGAGIGMAHGSQELSMAPPEEPPLAQLLPTWVVRQCACCPWAGTGLLLHFPPLR